MTDSTTLIKSPETINALKNSRINVTALMPAASLVALSLSLIVSSRCFWRLSRLIKVIAKWSISLPNWATSHHQWYKTHWIRLPQPINWGDAHWLTNATPFALFKALSACYQRTEGQTTFAYRIRNGKAWVSDGKAILTSATITSVLLWNT